MNGKDCNELIQIAHPNNKGVLGAPIFHRYFISRESFIDILKFHRSSESSHGGLLREIKLLDSQRIVKKLFPWHVALITFCGIIAR